MQSDTIYEVVIVGAGPTGLTLANILGLAGIQVLVIERNEATVRAPRAVSIDDESLRTMQAIGLVEEVMRDVAADYGSHYFDRHNRCSGLNQRHESMVSRAATHSPSQRLNERCWKAQGDFRTLRSASAVRSRALPRWETAFSSAPNTLTAARKSYVAVIWLAAMERVARFASR
jgi:2-polyprenyl-6-methoxyphenol hydroxylase-like FAD-dependent oxidoreductase